MSLLYKAMMFCFVTWECQFFFFSFFSLFFCLYPIFECKLYCQIKQTLTVIIIFEQKGKQLKQLAKNGDGGTTSSSINQDQQATSTQQLLQSLAARSSVVNTMTPNNPSPRQQPSAVGQVRDGPSGGQGSVGQIDLANVMSQVLHNPALNGLLTGVSEQTGVGSPNVLRNMLQQVTQNPQMKNAMNQIAQQVDTHDVENMFAGLGGQGGGIDFSRMFQQMMPIVSRALGSGSTAPQSLSAAEPLPQAQYNQQNQSRDEHGEQNYQVCLNIFWYIASVF